MPIVALAFHEQLARDRLERYFDSVQPAGGSAGCVSCPKCGVAFSIIYVNRVDEKNPEYSEKMRSLIGEDCINGIHRDEYVLSGGLELEH
jgi:hypothetical protein